MTPGLTLRPALVGLLGLSVAACGAMEDASFERLAQSAADVPLQGGSPSKPPKPREGTQPRPTVRVEVMSPHELWDARDGILQPAARAVPESAMPALALVVADVAIETPEAVRRQAVAAEAQTIQLGAYGSVAAARAAWDRLSVSEADRLAGMSPRFEPITVDGRNLVRLRLSVPAVEALALCEAVAAADPWCQEQP